MTNKEKAEKYLNHLGTKCITDYKDQDNASYQIYREETADTILLSLNFPPIFLYPDYHF